MPPPFVPLFRNPHLQTVAGHYWPRPHFDSSPVQDRLFTTEPGVQVMVQSQRPAGAAAGEVVMVHGLEGSSDAVYMRSLSVAALRAGYASHRLNLRTCGGTEHLCKTLYHAGLTSDLLAVLQEMRAAGRGPFYLAGFSLGGNIVLKLAGELGESALGWIGGVCAASTPLDLAACVDQMGRPENWLYQLRFVRRMRKRMLATGRFAARDFASIRTVFEVDNRITAPSFGFGDAANYYRTQSSLQYLGAIRVPTRLIQAKDDTYIPFEIYERAAVRANPCVSLLVTGHGGHLGFLARGGQRFWLDDAIMDWFRGASSPSRLQPPTKTPEAHPQFPNQNKTRP